MQREKGAELVAWCSVERTLNLSSDLWRRGYEIGIVVTTRVILVTVKAATGKDLKCLRSAKGSSRLLASKTRLEV